MTISGIVIAILVLVAGCILVSRSKRADNISKWCVGDVNPILTILLMVVFGKKDDDKEKEKKDNDNQK